MLKHRKRKEKALRKLEACEGNLNRLSDLISEIRRQLKPLGRQAEVARKAAVIQADVRDAQARLLADDLVQATLALESELADERACSERRLALEAGAGRRPGGRGRRPRRPSARACRGSPPPRRPGTRLAALRERVATTVSIARERMRNAETEPGEPAWAAIPTSWSAEADAVAAAGGASCAAEVAARAGPRRRRPTHRGRGRGRPTGPRSARLAALVRAAADRREGLARLHRPGQLAAQPRRGGRGRDRPAGHGPRAGRRAGRAAARAFTALETQVAGLDDGELGLDAEHEDGGRGAGRARGRSWPTCGREELAAAQERAALAARVEALQRRAATARTPPAALLAATEPVDGLLGSVAALVSVRAGYETAVAAALGAAADAVAVAGARRGARRVRPPEGRGPGTGRPAARRARAPEPTPPDRATGRPLPDGRARTPSTSSRCPDSLRGAVHRVLRKVAVVDDLPAARTLVAAAAGPGRRHPRRRRAQRPLRRRRLVRASRA